VKTEQIKWSIASGWSSDPAHSLGAGAQLVLVFGDTPLLGDPKLGGAIKEFYPDAQVLGCSTAGEICGTRVFDGSLVATAIQFDHTQVRGARVSLGDCADSFQAGDALARALPSSIPGSAPGAGEKLSHVLTFVDGLKVNGSDFVRGLTARLPEVVKFFVFF
jgi:hypothetical protein